MLRARVSSFFVVLGGFAMAAAFSCKTFDLPSETCSPSSMYESPSLTDADCGRCLEDHCCDAVGVCERTNGCAFIVLQTQSCVLNKKLKGASAEKDCAAASGLTFKRDDKLVNAEADGVYRCMRNSCGAQCSLPVCKVDKAAPLIRNAKCDECFAGGCCAPLNRCYENRACKLMLECIVDECGSALGKGLDDPAALPAIAADFAALCGDHPAPTPGVPECARTCLCRYRDNDQGLPPDDPSLLPINLASAVYACGKAAGCGGDCTPGRGGGAP